MVSFRLSQEIRAPPEFVVNWWLDYSTDDPGLTPGMMRRTVERIDANRVRLSTRTEFGGRVRTTEGTVARTGPTTWQMTGHVISSSVVVSTLQTSYVVDPTTDGSRVQADFEFVGKTIWWRLALAISGYSLRRRQRRSFEDFARAIERDHAAGRVPGGIPPSSTAPPGPATPPA